MKIFKCFYEQKKKNPARFFLQPHFSKSLFSPLRSPPLPSFQGFLSTHQSIGVSCCDCSRCRLAGRLWSSALWRAGNRRYRSRSPVCRRSNQQWAHLRSLAHWAHRMTQLQAARGQWSTHMFMHSTRDILDRCLVNTGMVGIHILFFSFAKKNIYVCAPTSATSLWCTNCVEF